MKLYQDSFTIFEFLCMDRVMDAIEKNDIRKYDELIKFYLKKDKEEILKTQKELIELYEDREHYIRGAYEEKRKKLLLSLPADLMYITEHPIVFENILKARK